MHTTTFVHHFILMKPLHFADFVFYGRLAGKKKKQKNVRTAIPTTTAKQSHNTSLFNT